MSSYLYTKKKIVVVDDVKLNHSIVKKVLQEYTNLQIDFIQDSRMVISRLENDSEVDLVILDWEMPFMNGPEVCRLMKKHPKLSEIPVVFCTANPSSTTIEEAFAVGAQDYINKPICPPELKTRIERLFHKEYLTQLLEKKFEEKNEVTRILSHDLNNYISLIAGSAELIKRKGASAPELAEKSIERILKSCDRMNQLIKNVREYQAIEDKKHFIKVEKLYLNEVLQEALSNFEAKIESKQLTVDFQNHLQDPLESVAILAERVSLLNSVFGNVISNAIKFSHRGDTLVFEIQERNGMIDLTVKDKGIGMTPALLQKVFDKSSSTSRMGTENEPGTGFGMPLVKSFMEHYGGRIEVESVSEEESIQNHGTSIHLEFKKCA